MGLFMHAKCEHCWDPIPCGCYKEKEQEEEAQRNREFRQELEMQKTNQLLQEQNELLRKLLKNND